MDLRNAFAVSQLSPLLINTVVVVDKRYTVVDFVGLAAALVRSSVAVIVPSE